MAATSDLEPLGPIEVDDSDVGAGAGVGTWVAGAISVVLILLAVFGLGGQDQMLGDKQMDSPAEPAAVVEPEAVNEGLDLTAPASSDPASAEGAEEEIDPAATSEPELDDSPSPQ